MPDYLFEAVLLLMLCAAYFWLTRGGGKLVFFTSMGAYLVLALSASRYRWGVVAVFAGLIFYLAQRKRIWGAAYVPVIARFEGGGIKRGLTAPEAAVVAGRPFNLTIAIVLLDLLKKGFVSIRSESDYVLELVDKMKSKSLNSQERIEMRNSTALEMGQVLQSYEDPFLEMLAQNPGVPIFSCDFSILVKPFVQHVAGRVGGFDLEETRNYYQLITERAPKEARTQGILVADPERVLGRNALWVLFNKNYQTVFMQDDFIFRPQWGPKEILFADWVTSLIEGLQTSISADALQMRLGKEIDALSATLMDEIANATYYG